MNRKQQATLRQIFSRPVPANVRWTDFESLMKALGTEMREGSGSRVRFVVGDLAAVFHRPHSSPYMRKGAVKAARQLLENLRVGP